MKIKIPEPVVGPGAYENLKTPQWLLMHSIKEGQMFEFSIFSRCKFIETNRISTLCVFLTDYKPTIMYNLEFIDQYDFSTQFQLFKHELRHVLFQEIGFAQAGAYDSLFEKFMGHEVFQTLKNDEQIAAMMKHIINIGMDLSVNSYMTENEKKELGNSYYEIVNPETGQKTIGGLIVPGYGQFKHLEPYKSSFEYVANILMSDNFKALSEIQLIDEHEIPEELKEEIRQKLTSGKKSYSKDKKEGTGESENQQDNHLTKEVMKDLIQKGLQAGSTSMPTELRKLLEKHFVQQVNWENVLENFVNCQIRSDSFSTVSRLNRRLPFDWRGKKVNRLPKIAVSIDQSGSVDDEMLQLAYAQLDRFAEIVEFTVIPFDCEVAEDKIFVWKKGERRALERVLHGGTNFDAPTDYVNDKDFDGSLIITDTYAPFPKRSNCQRLWLTTTDIRNPEFFNEAQRAGEEIIKIERNNNCM